MDSNEIRGMIESGEFLQHYGRKGMKWYQRIFTKYKEHQQKSKAKKSAKEEKKKSVTKEEVLKSRNPKTVAKNLDKLSDQEVRDILARMKWETEIKKLAKETTKTGLQHAKTLYAWTKQISDFYDLATTSNLGKAIEKKIFDKKKKEATGETKNK